MSNWISRTAKCRRASTCPIHRAAARSTYTSSSTGPKPATKPSAALRRPTPTRWVGPRPAPTPTLATRPGQINPTPTHVYTSTHKSCPVTDTAESVEKYSKKRPVGNREAVRKYREKKKARVASLEDEVVKLRALNQQLIKRLQGQALLEAEITRLKGLLVDIRGRIEGEIGSFPYQKPTMANVNNTGTYVVNPCNMQGSGDQLYCLHQGTENNTNRISGQGLWDCGFDDLRCLGNLNGEQQQQFDDC